MNINKLLSIAILASKHGGHELLRFWTTPFRIEEKEGATNLVTEADLASEKAIITQLLAKTAMIPILAEEGGKINTQNSPYLWVIDPLDGTTNFAHKYPVISVSIGLLYEGEPIVGVVHNPISKELFYAAKGKGAFLNRKPIQVSKVSSLEKSLLSTGFAYDRRETEDNNYKEFCKLTHISQGVRRAGSAAIDLSYVACGKFDGYWERGLQPWDMAAGVIIVREAGGVVTSYNQGPIDLQSGRVLASNGVIHASLSEKLNGL